MISRTLVYGALTVVLGAAYAGLVLAGQALFASFAGGSNLAIAVSTLVVAALFLPLRARVQRVVDRRFYRRRYDAQRTLDGLRRAGCASRSTSTGCGPTSRPSSPRRCSRRTSRCGCGSGRCGDAPARCDAGRRGRLRADRVGRAIDVVTIARDGWSSDAIADLGARAGRRLARVLRRRRSCGAGPATRSARSSPVSCSTRA